MRNPKSELLNNSIAPFDGVDTIVFPRVKASRKMVGIASEKEDDNTAFARRI